MATTISLCNSYSNPRHQPTSSIPPLSGSSLIASKFHHQNNKNKNKSHRSNLFRRLTVFAVTEGSAKKSGKEEEALPKWARPDSEEPPPWAKNEYQQQSSSSSFEIPFYAYLLASAVTAIAAIGSVFEYLNQNPAFGVVYPDSIFYAPLLGFFAFTGIPTSAFLWFKSVETANKEAEEQDRRDGYR
ncbi:hypothetical protein LguiA_013830 [Lonicera macranthoides]